MKPENKIIKDIFDFDNCMEWGMEYKDIFGNKGFMFCWNYEDLIKLMKKYPNLKKVLCLDCDMWRNIEKEFNIQQTKTKQPCVATSRRNSAESVLSHKNADSSSQFSDNKSEDQN
jgi:hypothetical protein